jgi:hypothetical protein
MNGAVLVACYFYQFLTHLRLFSMALPSPQARKVIPLWSYRNTTGRQKRSNKQTPEKAMQNRYVLLAAVGLGALFLGRKLYQIRNKQLEHGRQHSDNTVDITSADSFPASDAPSWTPVQSAQQAQ